MEKKLMDFFDASRIVAGTERGIEYKYGEFKCWYYEESNRLGQATLVGTLDAEKHKLHHWWPSVDQQKEKAWEVEPEKPKEVFVWVITVGDYSYLHTEEPFQGIIGDWYSENGGRGIAKNNAFPKDKPQQFKLVSADQPSGIPWEKFEADKMPDKLFKFLAVMEDGSIIFDWWVNKPRQGGLWRPDILEIMLIEYYCPVDKIPKPNA